MRTDRVLLLLAVALAAVCGTHAAGRSAKVRGTGAAQLGPRIASSDAIGQAYFKERTVATPDAAPTAGQGQRRALRAAQDWQCALLDLVNAARSDAGLSPLCLNAKLNDAAQAHANDQAAMGRMTHDGSDGSRPGERVERRGYSWSMVAENVARGYPSVQDVFQGWMESPGHHANIMNPKAQHMGAGFNSNGNYWAQVFGASNTEGCSA